MTEISKLIMDKQQKDVEKEVSRRMERITEVRTKLIDLLKAENFSVQDATICLKACQDKISLSFGEKALSDVV